MAAKVARFQSKASQVQAEQAAELRQMVLSVEGLPPDLVGQLLANIDRRIAAENGWTFVMMSPDDHDRVVEWLAAHSVVPVVAMRLWSKLFRHLRWDTGEVMQTREELAEAVGVAPGKVSVVMTELESIGAISRQRVKIAGMRGPGAVRYFMNPTVATHLTGAARDKAQEQAPKVAAEVAPGSPRFGVIQGGAK